MAFTRNYVDNVAVDVAYRDTDNPLSWMGRGVCREFDPELWFQHTPSKLAVEICRDCPVITECAEYALDYALGKSIGGSQGRYQQLAGIWGGMTERKRNQVLRRRMRELNQPERVK